MNTPEISRRTFVRAAAAAGGTVVISGAMGAPWAAALTSKKRVYVLVVDGCRPDEITAAKTPNLFQLRTSGRWFPNARSLPIMETIPNHVMMMTGVLPDRSGVPANVIYDRTTRTTRDCSLPSDITTETILKRINKAGHTTGTVLSKTYLYSVFGTQATYRWEPSPTLPVTNHAPDVATMSALRSMVTTADPCVVFCNLGDIDRAGHADITGTTLQAARQAALASTDAQIGSFVSFLKSTGRWGNTHVIVLADHQMDWSTPDKVVSINSAFAGNSLLDGTFAYACNGGADLLYYLGPSTTRSAALAEAAKVAAATPGVLSVHTPAQLRLGTKAGDLVIYCKAGWRLSDPDLKANPIPGNHGHPATQAIPFFISGGAVRTPAVLSDRVHTVDVAPTIGKIMGIGGPTGGYVGQPRV